MIKKIQSLKAKRGFTIVELIVVVGVIAALLAVVLPNIDTSRSKITEARSTARDFYSALQTMFTKYSLYEAALNPALESEETYIKYTPSLGGNFPVNQDTYIEIAVKGGKVSYTLVGAADTDIFNTTTKADNSEFAKKLSSDVDGLIKLREGYYYALVRFKSNGSVLDPTQKPNTVKVVYAAYMGVELPPLGGMTYAAYKSKYLLFTEDYRLADGTICGVNTSAKYNASKTDNFLVAEEDGADYSGGYIGTAGSFLANH